PPFSLSSRRLIFSRCLLLLLFYHSLPELHLYYFPTRRSSDLLHSLGWARAASAVGYGFYGYGAIMTAYCSMNFLHVEQYAVMMRSEAHTSELQSRFDIVCRLLLEKYNFFPLTLHFLSRALPYV